ncbi:MAG: glycosyltransferase family 2 protein [Calothrix sp. MO_167.B12]|nr:glycosyltransferase family 2 protein [Calothrix sp. MO_167.B12]
MPLVNTASTLKDLPAPPEGKTGWPWTEGSEPLPEKMPDGSEWPRISIVTPNYNYGHFLEETIRSVLLQGYPNLEYIIIDGGSTDNSVEIIKKYEHWLSYWVSEKDKGQTDAINTGLKYCSGKLFNWINSDDQLQPQALCKIAQLWAEHQPDIVIGGSIGIDLLSGRKIHELIPIKPKKALDLMKYGQFDLQISQPSTFLRLTLVQDMGYLNDSLHYAFDWAFYFKVLVLCREVNIITFSDIVSTFLIHSDAKTSQSIILFVEEGKTVIQDLYPHLNPWEKLQVILHIMHIESYQIVEQILTNHDRSLSLLMKILLIHPQLCLSRFFWGAVKREIFYS